MDPYSDWRLVSPGGIRHKLVSQQGGFGEEDADWTMVVIIRGVDLYDFMWEVFPPPVFGFGGIVYPRRFYPAGLPALRAVKADVVGNVDGRPIDPFSVDSGAASGTYEEFLRVTISFSTCPEGDSPDSNDPFTFLEVSSSASGAFLTSKVDGSNILWEQGPLSELPDEEDSALQQQVSTSLVEHNCKWSQIPYDWYRTTLRPRLNDMLGKVNDSDMPLFEDSPAETILFDSWSKGQQFTWRNGFAGVPPITLDLKFIEKNFEDSDGEQVTHNHFWRPNKGWWKLRFGHGASAPYTYPQADLNDLFKP